MDYKAVKKAQREVHRAFDNWVILEANGECTGNSDCPRCNSWHLLQLKIRIAIDVAREFLADEPLPPLDPGIKKQLAKCLKVRTS
jgi:hypothetical protein